MLHYILQIIAFQVFFLLVYDLFLKKETFFNWNRTYLLVTSLFSFVLPIIKIKAIQEALPQEFLISLPEVIITSPNDVLVNTVLLDTIYITGTSVSYIQWFFCIGFGVSIGFFTLKLVKIIRLIYKNPKSIKEGYCVVNLLKSNAAFSFLNYVFIGDEIVNEEAQQIFEHEKVHVQQKHTLDLLYFELLRIIFWFNPLIYIYQNRTAELHEFIADAKAIKSDNKAAYYQNLLSQIFGTQRVSFINTFFKQSLIKKRIIMLSKKQSKTILKLKYALLIPVVFGMLMYTSCTQEPVLTKSDDTSIIQDVESLKAKIANTEAITDEEKKQILSLLQETYQKELNGTLKTQYKEVDYTNAKEVPFSVIEQVPVFPGCELGTNEEQKKCMVKKISNLINSNFNVKLASDLNLSGKQKIYVGFKVNKAGYVTNVRARAPHAELAKEAERVVKLLPKMLPGKQDGVEVIVPYSLPILFDINE